MHLLPLILKAAQQWLLLLLLPPLLLQLVQAGSLSWLHEALHRRTHLAMTATRLTFTAATHPMLPPCAVYVSW